MRVDLSGLRFGRLVVVGAVGKDARGNVLNRCLCDCGGSVDVATCNLRRGRKRSCGCFEAERKQSNQTKIQVGERYGRLLVLDRVPDEAYVVFRARCDCGKEKDFRSFRILTMKYPSCGCWSHDQGGIKRRIDLTGRRFGKLVVQSKHSHGRPARWNCFCDCGREKVVPTQSLTSGKTNSCGCALYDEKVYTSQSALSILAAARAKRRARLVNSGGSFSAKDIENLYTAQKGRCVYCRERLGNRYHRDHIVPLKLGGDNSIYNIQLLCAECNLKKGSKDPVDWAQSIGMVL